MSSDRFDLFQSEVTPERFSLEEKSTLRLVGEVIRHNDGKWSPASNLGMSFDTWQEAAEVENPS